MHEWKGQSAGYANSVSAPMIARRHFTPLVAQYGEIASFIPDYLHYFDQSLTYLSVEMATDITNNLKEHFCQMITKYFKKVIVVGNFNPAQRTVAQTYARNLSESVIQGRYLANLDEAGRNTVDNFRMRCRLLAINVNNHVTHHPLKVSIAPHQFIVSLAIQGTCDAIRGG